MDKRKTNREIKRLKGLLDRANVPDHTQEMLSPVIENLAWQRIKLNETREELEEASVVIDYNNGGGQKGKRENPIFKGYISLWRSYMLGLEKLSSYLPQELKAEAAGESLSILAQVELMKKGNE